MLKFVVIALSLFAFNISAKVIYINPNNVWESDIMDFNLPMDSQESNENNFNLDDLKPGSINFDAAEKEFNLSSDDIEILNASDESDKIIFNLLMNVPKPDSISSDAEENSDEMNFNRLMDKLKYDSKDASKKSDTNDFNLQMDDIISSDKDKKSNSMNFSQLDELSSDASDESHKMLFKNLMNSDEKDFNLQINGLKPNIISSDEMEKSDTTNFSLLDKLSPDASDESDEMLFNNPMNTDKKNFNLQMDELKPDIINSDKEEKSDIMNFNLWDELLSDVSDESDKMFFKNLMNSDEKDFNLQMNELKLNIASSDEMEKSDTTNFSLLEELSSDASDESDEMLLNSLMDTDKKGFNLQMDKLKPGIISSDEVEKSDAMNLLLDELLSDIKKSEALEKSDENDFDLHIDELEHDNTSSDASEISSEVEPTTTPKIIKETDYEYTKIGSKVYIINNKNRANWFEAGHICCKLGGQLVNIENAEEMSFLSNYLLENGYEHNAFWTSGSDMNQENTFIFWNNGKEMKYFNWAEYEPNNMYGNENCIHIVKREAWEFVMNDANCHHDLNFICETDF